MTMPSFGTKGAIRAVPSNAGHFGQGIAYPLEFDASGRLTLSYGTDSVDDSIASIVSTQPGERPLQPDYGMAALEFEPIGDLDRARIELEGCIADHEPRIASATITGERGGAQNVEETMITYRPTGEANDRTLTYPYFSPPATTSTGTG